MSYSHRVIINYICKMISWKSIAFHQHLIIDHTVLNRNLTMNKVFKLSLAFRNLHSKHMRFSTLNSSFSLFSAQMHTFSIIFLLIPWEMWLFFSKLS